MIEILSVRSSTATVKIKEQVLTVSLYWFDGTYRANTRSLGFAFENFDGRGSNATEAISDLFKAIGVFLMVASEQLEKETIQ